MPAGRTDPDDRDDESGRFTSGFDDDEFVAAVDELDGPAGTVDVADHVGCDRRTAYQRLNKLADSGEVEKIEVGRSLAWRVIDE